MGEARDADPSAVHTDEWPPALPSPANLDPLYPRLHSKTKPINYARLLWAGSLENAANDQYAPRNC